MSRLVFVMKEFRITGVFSLLLFAVVDHSFSQDLPRIIVSTDIGGDDPDDYQSMVHLLMYADRFRIEGLISSPPDKGRKVNIKEVISEYEKDYEQLCKHARFPMPSYLTSVTKQGAIDVQSDKIPKEVSEGAAWIILKE